MDGALHHYSGCIPFVHYCAYYLYTQVLGHSNGTFCDFRFVIFFYLPFLFGFQPMSFYVSFGKSLAGFFDFDLDNSLSMKSLKGDSL